MCFQLSNSTVSFRHSLIHELFNRVFYLWNLWTVILSQILSILEWKAMLKFMMVLCRFWILKHIARVQLLSRFNCGPKFIPNSAVLLLRFLLKIRSVRILDTIVCSGTLLWLFSPAWDAVKLTLKVGFVCPFVVIDPKDLGSTFVVAQALCLAIFNLSPTHNTCLFTDGNKAIVWVVCYITRGNNDIPDWSVYSIAWPVLLTPGQ